MTEEHQKRPTRPRPDPREVFKQAFRFFVALRALHQYRRQNPAHENVVDLPLLVLTAFMCELALKAQIGAEGGQLAKNSHDLKLLFQQLKPETQTAVEAEWDKIMVAKEEETKELDIKLGYQVPRDLRKALEQSKESFAELRYIYETGEGSSFIVNLPLALSKVLLDLHPDWRHL